MAESGLPHSITAGQRGLRCAWCNACRSDAVSCGAEHERWPSRINARRAMCEVNLLDAPFRTARDQTTIAATYACPPTLPPPYRRNRLSASISKPLGPYSGVPLGGLSQLPFSRGTHSRWQHSNTSEQLRFIRVGKHGGYGEAGDVATVAADKTGMSEAELAGGTNIEILQC